MTDAACPIPRRRIHFDPVIPHPRLDFLSVHIRNNQVRFLNRHVAIDAIVANPRAQFCELPAVAVFLVLQALFPKSRRRAFGCVHFMAGKTMINDVVVWRWQAIHSAVLRPPKN